MEQIELLLNKPALTKSFLKKKDLFAIYFDGGCKPNPGRKYGSYQIVRSGITIHRQLQFDLGWGTNNEAEFEALSYAIQSTIRFCENNKINMKAVRLAIFTDSTIVRNWLYRFHSFNPVTCKNQRRLAMAGYAAMCIGGLSEFSSFVVEWKERSQNVKRFGH